ncbi:hypothetical protein WJX81_004472 [Elliptochloris bilobata]|uniref:fructose-bisphosphate aldolase n=1 Tax=Elliptochloris bilobata TaxID=381761 RepID=A0AAW1S1D2_9CHLO
MSSSTAELCEVAQQLTAPGKGLLASDESTGTIGKRLAKAGILNTEENRRQYRELFYTADIGGGISGAILYEEALYQSASDGTPFVECLRQQGVLPGVKVDEGLVPFGEVEGETETRGLGGLAERCRRYRRAGVRFAKWRAALRISGEHGPSEAAAQRNAEQLAEYAAVCQACGLVPIVEPEVLIDGSHGIERSGAAAERVLQACVAALWRSNVVLEATLLKPMMVMPGADHTGSCAWPKEVAQATLTALRRSVPPAVPGIMFLSGGLSEEQATVNLNEINRAAAASGGAPWRLSFSFGRALQASVLEIWKEDRECVAAMERARAMAAALAAANGAASAGRYEAGSHPSILSGGGSLREAFRGWRAP